MKIFVNHPISSRFVLLMVKPSIYHRKVKGIPLYDIIVRDNSTKTIFDYTIFGSNGLSRKYLLSELRTRSKYKMKRLNLPALG